MSFTILPGELVAIVGPSGAGKTTLLEAIAGITPATSGAVRFDGIDVHANLGGFRSVLGYVPQDDIIHADLPLVRTLRYARRCAFLRRPAAVTSTRRCVARSSPSGSPSSGRPGWLAQRRSAQARQHRRRAAHRPHVFFLDEPTSGLDPLTSAELATRLRQLADRSATVVFTTHSIDDLNLCDRIVFMAAVGVSASSGPSTRRSRASRSAPSPSCIAA